MNYIKNIACGLVMVPAIILTVVVFIIAGKNPLEILEEDDWT